jgi:hypothetical protein
MVAELFRMPRRVSLRVSCSASGKRRCRSATMPLYPLDPEDLAEYEQDQEGEREDREHQVVGDHPRKPGDVLSIGPDPERL